ncbi:MAG: AAA family ATPase [Clostridiales bacterium]|jgi:hypothetical protein|nr:AAA family ATPase [Clostridiales bacterium]
MYIFKDAFGRHREDKEIFMGFGLKHKDNVSRYYVSPRNEESDSTFIAQEIGEGVNLLLDAIQETRAKQDERSNIWQDYGPVDYSYTEIYPSAKWFDACVIDDRIKSYKIIAEKYSSETDGGFMAYSRRIKIGCYGEDGKLLPETKQSFQKYACVLPIFALLAASFDETCLSGEIGDFATMAEGYFFKPTVENFVKYCEEFYQVHKDRDYYIEYVEVKNKSNLSEMTSMFSFYAWVDDATAHGDLYEAITVKKFDVNEFSSEYISFIPKLPRELIMDRELKPIANALQSGDCISFLQHGASGTGKTINCKLICAAIGLPIMETINCSENLDEFALGKFIPTKNGIEFAESYVTKAIRYGGAVVFEEINFAKPQYLAFLNSLLDDNGFVRLDNNEVVRRHKSFRFFATMNFGYYGTKELNQALYNRFQLIKKIHSIDDAKIKNMLLARMPSCEKHIGKMLKVYRKIADKIKKEELDYVISPRNLESWAKLAAQIGFVEAADTTIIQISKGDEEMERTVRKLVGSFVWE